MTVHKIRTCGCGHEEAMHEKGMGPCLYGHGHVMGGCTCPSFGRRKRASAKPAVESYPGPAILAAPDALLAAIDAVMRGLGAMRVALAPRQLPGHVKPFAGVVGVKNGGLTSSLARSEPRDRARRARASSGQLRRGERHLLEVAARHHPVRLTRAQLATLAGFTASGGTYQTYLSVLRREGLVDEDDARLICATDAGLTAAGVPGKRPMTRAEVVEQWRAALRRGERDMLDVILKHGPRTRSELAEIVDMEASGGTFSTYLSVLRRNGLVEVEGKSVRLGKALQEARA